MTPRSGFVVVFGDDLGRGVHGVAHGRHLQELPVLRALGRKNGVVHLRHHGIGRVDGRRERIDQHVLSQHGVMAVGLAILEIHVDGRPFAGDAGEVEYVGFGDGAARGGRGRMVQRHVLEEPGVLELLVESSLQLLVHVEFLLQDDGGRGLVLLGDVVVAHVVQNQRAVLVDTVHGQLDGARAVAVVRLVRDLALQVDGAVELHRGHELHVLEAREVSQRLGRGPTRTRCVSTCRRPASA